MPTPDSLMQVDMMLRREQHSRVYYHLCKNLIKKDVKKYFQEDLRKEIEDEFSLLLDKGNFSAVIADLERAGLLNREKIGRSNRILFTSIYVKKTVLDAATEKLKARTLEIKEVE